MKVSKPVIVDTAQRKTKTEDNKKLTYIKRSATYVEKNKKNTVVLNRDQVLQSVKESDCIFILEAGKNEDGTQYQVFKVDGLK